jgi:hypothetical protein
VPLPPVLGIEVCHSGLEQVFEEELAHRGPRVGWIDHHQAGPSRLSHPVDRDPQRFFRPDGDRAGRNRPRVSRRDDIPHQQNLQGIDAVFPAQV